MSEFGEHASDWKSEYGDNWGKNGLRKNPRRAKDDNTLITERAKIVKKTEGVLNACPGVALYEEIEVLNDTFFAWKKGCTLTFADEQTFKEAQEAPVEKINVPILQKVKGKETIKIVVLLTLLSHI